MKTVKNIFRLLTLAAWIITSSQVLASERQLSIDGTPTVVSDTGPQSDPTPVVLIHALGLDHKMWSETASVLAQNHRVIAYDVRAHGASRHAPAPFDMQRLSEDLVELLNALGLRRAHVVGLSMGGVIAQTLATRHPERVESLTLIATPSRPQAAFSARGASGLRDGMNAQVVPTLTRWFTPDQLAENTQVVNYARDMVKSDDAKDWEASWQAMATMDVFDRLPAVTAPTLVIAGEADVSCPPGLMFRDIAQRIPSARFEIITGAPHMVSLTAPGELATSINRFLSQLLTREIVLK